MLSGNGVGGWCPPPGLCTQVRHQGSRVHAHTLIASRIDGRVLYLPLLRPKKKGLLPAIALGVGIYGVILGGYFLVSPFFDFSRIAGALTENAGVTKVNFLYVSLYISFANSFLEEFFVLNQLVMLC